MTTRTIARLHPHSTVADVEAYAAAELSGFLATNASEWRDKGDTSCQWD